MIERGVLDRLRRLRATAVAHAADWPDEACRKQHHPALSPMSWHLGHVFFVEAYWLREVVLNDGTRTRPLHELFFPELNVKSGRGDCLPHRNELLAWCAATAVDNDAAWERAAHEPHPLLSDDYLPWFLTQHYAQHLETMAMVAQQRTLATPAHAPPAPLTVPAPAATVEVTMPGGAMPIGAPPDTRAAYDNELPRHERDVAPFAIARRPVSNAQWLAFMSENGYSRTDLWDTESLAWRVLTGVCAPDHWRAHPDGGWYAIGQGGAEPLPPQSPVSGVSHFEARAYARWADARLPHEHEWEHAAGRGALEATGEVWEWCANPLYPYRGFRAFPYDGYSKPWFDDRHLALRGGSRHTLPEVRRPSFRNFYTPDQRHVFAGLRLARSL